MNELDVVVLTEDIPEHGLKAGDSGTIVFVYRDGEAYEVEFIARTGETVALVSLLPSQVRPPRDDEITAVRQM